jgi:uncharacterized protein YoxC
MIEAIAHAGMWLQQAAAVGRDTVFMQPLPAPPSVFERVTGVASGLMSIALLVFTVAAVPAAWNFRKSYKRVNKLLERIYGDINPIVRHASSIADNVDYVTTAVRTDVQQINATIASANQRLQAAIATTEGRLQEFNALLAVVQEEAEQMFVSTASTMRGVRRGAASLRSDLGTDLAMRADDGLDRDETELLDDVEENDGDDDDSRTEPAGARAAGPRVRRRGRGV